MNEPYHIPVLLKESIEGLNIDPAGVYVDATYGGGGHSAKILEQLTTGKLVAFDQDVDAEANIRTDEHLIFVQHNFKYISNFLKFHEIEKVDGILADLGVSSHDFDVAERGFSFRFDGNLDMRMNQSSSFSAVQVVNDYTPEELMRIFNEYGEIQNAKKTALAIVAARAQQRIETTSQLCAVLEPLVPQKAASKYLAKVFQSIRIEVNQELSSLKKFLIDAAEALRPGGRFVVISYHSLEDRLVKNFFQRGNFEGNLNQDFYGNIETPFRTIGKKFIVPSDEEIERNPRARSAKLRIVEKI